MDTDVTQQENTIIEEPQNNSHAANETSEDAKNNSKKETVTSSSDESDVEPDLVQTINHNVHSSFGTMKELVQEEDTSNTFLQRYFSNHSNSLPSKMTMASRRLSQCREEDEEDEKKEPSNMSTISGSDMSLSESSSGSKTSVIDTISGPTHKFVITKTKTVKETKNEEIEPKKEKEVKSAKTEKKELSEAAMIFARNKEYRMANTVLGVPSRDATRPSVRSLFRSPLQSPHYDSRFFDSSLVSIKSETSSSSTLDYSGSAEDIWIKRPVSEFKKELGSQPLPQISFEDDSHMPRPRSGTWGSKSEKQKSKETPESRRKRDKESKSGTTSRSNSSERRGSVDSSPKKHGFRKRSNSDAGKRKGSTFMASMKSAMVHTGLMHAKKTPRDGSAHPVQDDESDIKYYHTVTAAASASRSPMTKVMDIFRKPHVPSPPPPPEEEKEKKKKEKYFMHSRPKAPRDGSAHPVRDGGSDTQYYHTVTAGSSSRSPMTKVMDIFRNRSHVNVPPDDRKKVFPGYRSLKTIPQGGRQF